MKRIATVHALILVLCFLHSVHDLTGHETAITAQRYADCDDADGDGWCPPEDCDDGASGIHPGALEIPGNGIDENCDGSDAAVCYADADGDGYGDPWNVFLSGDGDCDDPGEAWTGTDCDDLDGSIHPGADDIPDDGIDQDCDGADATSSPAQPSTWSLIKMLYRE